MVPLIAQSYEQAMISSRLGKYIFRCEKVIEANALMKFFQQGRTLQTFSISIAQQDSYGWPGTVMSIKSFV